MNEKIETKKTRSSWSNPFQIPPIQEIEATSVSQWNTFQVSSIKKKNIKVVTSHVQLETPTNR